MIDDPLGAVDYSEQGSGPTLVLVPGSCSTGAAWRPMIAALGNGYRCITTSLPGCGGTAERRTTDDFTIDHVAEAVEAVVRRAAAPVHLVGHSFGGLVATAVALRRSVPLASLAVLEAPVVTLLSNSGDDAHYAQAFRAMTEANFADFAAGDPEAVAAMIDFYGGVGTFAGWPERVRAYACATTAANIRDWQSAYAFSPTAKHFSSMRVPCLVMWGGKSHSAVVRANALLATALNARSGSIPGASHFMIATHPIEVATVLASHIANLEA